MQLLQAVLHAQMELIAVIVLLVNIYLWQRLVQLQPIV